MLADEMLTVPEVAEHLRVSRVRAYDLIKEAGIPHVRLSEHRIRVPRGQFESWLSERVVCGEQAKETPSR